MPKFKEYQQLDLPSFEKAVLQYWKDHDIFEKSVALREGKPSYVFYEGPPSANGLPGIHHVISRSIKDVFCRYKTLKGYQVKRKAGWDTHGLPIELQVEKKLGITKEDIGTKISIEEYNKACREDVLKFKDVWDEITDKIGYWVDLSDPYVTYENEYIETVWWLLKQLHEKGLLYKGYTIQPYSPAAGTGLSSHELNQPGTYRDVTDTTVVAQFKLKDPSAIGLDNSGGDVFCIAWTTTPWTLPSNTALGVGPKIDYVALKTVNRYTQQPVTVIMAKALMHKYFNEEAGGLDRFEPKHKKLPYEVVSEFKGSELNGLQYEQLLPWVQPEGKAFEIITADFVSTEDGTGIVHLAPSFGADDFKAANEHGISALTLVDKQGKFIDEVGEYAGKYVKNYTEEDESDPNYKSTDVQIAIKLKEENKAFLVEKYVHSYPHCWRTDKPILYYPLESWFIKTTAFKDRLLELNNTINWKPKSTGEGRFGNWLENLVDWNLSRSRYWGTPLPVWRTADGQEEKCIGSIEELREEVDRSVELGLMKDNPYRDNPDFDLHRPFIDHVILASEKGEPMQRETDLIDVWFDSGAMPYAQQHYPFENQLEIDGNEAFPADFIAEGVDQTRGWFFTLHAIGVMLFDSVAYKNVVANGLVLDKNGNKMSKRLGNTVDPFETVDTYGADAVRWYMLSNAAPWDNLKFDLDGVQETQRKFFGTLYNTYSFFSLYANIDGFDHNEEEVPLNERPEIDRWVISKLNHLVKDVDGFMDDYEPTKAARAIQQFVIDDLSNWYVRLCRRRFWKGDYSKDKSSAYQTLYRCLQVCTKLIAPISPFYADQLYRDLNSITKMEDLESVHLSDYPECYDAELDHDLEYRMDMAQRITSLTLGIRKKEKIRVRQPLQKVVIPVLNDEQANAIRKVSELIKAEVNVKEVELLSPEENDMVTKSILPDFKKLGPRFGPKMKLVAAAVKGMDSQAINEIERAGSYDLEVDGEMETIQLEEVQIKTNEVPGWKSASDGNVAVALDVNITENLKQEGIARELVNRIQQVRKDNGLEVVDKIRVKIEEHPYTKTSVEVFSNYICGEILAVDWENSDAAGLESSVDIDGNVIGLTIQKVEG
jgi:isoleucyl-tRNA synthetase